MGPNNLESMRQLKAMLTSERRNKEWPEATCRLCKGLFRYHCSWSPVPTVCRFCRAEGKAMLQAEDGDSLHISTPGASRGSPNNRAY